MKSFLKNHDIVIEKPCKKKGKDEGKISLDTAVENLRE